MNDSNSQTKMWCVSDYNFLNEVKAGWSLPKHVVINDMTLREGEETSGVILRPNEMIEIAQKLDEIGVSQIQLRGPDVISKLRQLALNAKTEVLAPAMGKNWKQPIDTFINCGIDIIDILHGTSKWFLMRYEEKLSQDALLERVTEQVEYAKERGVIVSVDPMDGTRTEIDFLLRFYKTAVEAGADRIRLLDTLGVCGPAGWRWLVKTLKKEIPNTLLGVHCHNDFGQGMANLLASLEEGAEILDVTVNGIGQRLGNPPLAEVVMALTVLYGINLRIKTEKLYDLSHLVQDLTRFPIPKNMPLVGEWAFSAMQGGYGKVPIDGLNPKAVGNVEKTILWKFNIQRVLRKKLSELGITVSEEDISRIMARAAYESDLRKKALTGDDLQRIIRELQ